MLDDLIMTELNITRSLEMCLFVFFSGKSAWQSGITNAYNKSLKLMFILWNASKSFSLHPFFHLVPFSNLVP